LFDEADWDTETDGTNLYAMTIDLSEASKTQLTIPNFQDYGRESGDTTRLIFFR
jgi:hypothetical protein